MESDTICLPLGVVSARCAPIIRVTFFMNFPGIRAGIESDGTEELETFKNLSVVTCKCEGKDYKFGSF